MRYLLFVLPLILISVSIHEFAHGWVASLRGDSTAREMGRLTLNPLAHVSWMGMVVVPVILVLTVGIPFGWANPVPINPLRLKNPKRDMIWVALAGPCANFLLATMALLLLRYVGSPLGDAGQVILIYLALMNLALAFLNLIPVPPLDGSRVVTGLLPRKQALQYAQLERYGFWIVLILLYFGLAEKWIRGGMSLFLRLFGFGGIHQFLGVLG